MSYVVLARKYRPLRFADIVGQDHIVRTLQNAIRLDRVHHAFLFTGARGVGKTTTARVLAAALNCEGGPHEDPPADSPTASAIAAGRHPDVLEIDGASNTGVDNVRELRENIRYLPSQGRFKLYIIDEVHMLSQAAFNALLKTLEEPPAHAKFIFATTEPQKIPVTILSRCQRFDFRRVSVAKLTEHVRGILEKENVSIEPGALLAVIREAQGSVRDALSLLEQVLSFAGGDPTEEQVLAALGVVDRQTIFEICGAVLARDARLLLEIVAEVDARGHDLSDVAGLILQHLRDLMVVSVTDAPSESLLDRSPGELEALRAQSKNVAAPDLQRLFTVMVRVAEDVNRSLYPRVTLEMGLLCLLEVEPSQSLGTLLEKVDALLDGSGAVQASAPSRGGHGGGAATQVSKCTADAKGPSRQPALEVTPQISKDHIAWKQVVQRVHTTSPALASVLQHGRVLSFAPDGVVVGFQEDTFYWDSVREPESKALLERVLAEQFGLKVPLSLRPLDRGQVEDVPSLAEYEDRAEQVRQDEIREGVLSHPGVKSALSILGGQIKEVIPLAAEGSSSDSGAHEME